MRVIILSALMGVSFIAFILSVMSMNWLTLLSGAVFGLTVLYISRHEKDLEPELEDIFGRDAKFR